MSLPSTAFRDALARFASGVVIVAAHTPTGPVGFTASAFTSVSLEPPLILVCVGKNASAYAGVVGATTFGVSILHERQRWIAEQFGRHGAARFAGIALRSSVRVPLIEGAIAQLECGRHALHDAGDHTILVGEVHEAFLRPERPLVHYSRTFGGFTVEPSPPLHASDLPAASNGGPR